MKKQRTFTPAFKAKVAMDAIKGVKTIEKISEEYEIHPTQIHKWKNQAINNMATIFDKNDIGQVQTLKEANEKKEQKLYGEIGRLTIENNWLKKTLGE